MPPPYTGEEVVKALVEMRYYPESRTGSHAKLRYDDPNTGEVRNVTVPLGGEIPIGTLHNIAEQCGAHEFQEWCDWLDGIL